MQSQSRRELRQLEACYRVAPLAGDFSRGSQHKNAAAHLQMGNDEIGFAPDTATPQDNIEIQRPRAPSLPPSLRARAAKAPFDILEGRQAFARGVPCLNHGRAVGVSPKRGANGVAFDDFSHIPRFYPFALQFLQRRSQHRAR